MGRQVLVMALLSAAMVGGVNASGAAPIAGAASRACGDVAAEVGLLDVRARNASCRRARRAARQWLRNVFAGRCTRFDCYSLGLRCRARPPARVRYRVRCRGGGQRVGWTVVAD